MLTATEALSASILVTVLGVAGGVLLYRYLLLRLATETWVAAIAAAPLVLMYPLYLVIFGRSALTIVMMGFTAGLAPVILKTLEGLVRHAARADQCGQELQPHALAAVLEDPVPGGAADHLRRAAARADLLPDQHRRVEFLINFGGLGQLINELAERYDLPGTYAAICFVILVSVCVFVLMERLERWLRPVD